MKNAKEALENGTAAKVEKQSQVAAIASNAAVPDEFKQLNKALKDITFSNELIQIIDLSIQIKRHMIYLQLSMTGIPANSVMISHIGLQFEESIRKRTIK